ncbi:MAG: hypothetical protein EOO88_01165 [Pedobacter sp.]|nr:MAG: hypothetical protein EOO88_01165 [Pedobacter sp.]
MKYSVLLIAFAFTSLVLQAQDSSVLTRTPYQLTLAVDGKTYYEEQIKAVPYIFPNKSVQVYPGETIYLEVTLNDGEITAMNPVKEIVRPKATLTLQFVQKTEKKKHSLMMLTVENPFPFDLTYEALIFTFSQKKWSKTSIIPVRAGLSGIEMWPDLITSIALGNWKFAKTK